MGPGGRGVPDALSGEESRLDPPALGAETLGEGPQCGGVSAQDPALADPASVILTFADCLPRSLGLFT